MDTYKIRNYLKNDKGIIVPEDTLEQLVDMTIETFGDGMSRQEVEDHALGGDVLYTAARDGIVVGFCSMNFEPKENQFYLAGAVVHKNEQSNGLYKKFARLRIRDGLAFGLSNLRTQTQNPSIERGIRDVLDECISQEIIQGYCVDRIKMAGVYGRMLTKKVPKSSDSDLNRVYSRLDYPAGDAYALNFCINVGNKGISKW